MVAFLPGPVLHSNRGILSSPGNLLQPGRLKSGSVLEKFGFLSRAVPGSCWQNSDSAGPTDATPDHCCFSGEGNREIQRLLSIERGWQLAGCREIWLLPDRIV